MAIVKTFRDVRTGIVRDYPVVLANHFPNLVPTDKEEVCISCTEAPAAVDPLPAPKGEPGDATPDEEEED